MLTQQEAHISALVDILGISLRFEGEKQSDDTGWVRNKQEEQSYFNLQEEFRHEQEIA